MSKIDKQVAEVVFDDGEGVYRAVVEYYNEEEMLLASVPVAFTGEKNVTFQDIEAHAFKVASEILASLT